MKLRTRIYFMPGPLDEREYYEHPDDSPIDTCLTPPDDFVQNVNVYVEYDDEEEEENYDEELDD